MQGDRTEKKRRFGKYELRLRLATLLPNLFLRLASLNDQSIPAITLEYVPRPSLSNAFTLIACPFFATPNVLPTAIPAT